MQLKQKEKESEIEIDAEWVELHTEAGPQVQRDLETETVYGTPSASASVSRSNSGFEFEDADEGEAAHYEQQRQQQQQQQRDGSTHGIPLDEQTYDTDFGPAESLEMAGGGVYTLTSCAEGALGDDEVMMDLSGGDSRSVIGFPAHGFENQQWHFERLGAGWSIQSVHTGTYLTIALEDVCKLEVRRSTSGHGADAGIPISIVASAYPVAWAVRRASEDVNVNINIDHRNLNSDMSSESGGGMDVRIFWPNSPYNIELDGGSAVPGTKIVLRRAMNRHSLESRHQAWRTARRLDAEAKLAQRKT